jgi:phosphatidylserine decarboxylase
MKKENFFYNLSYVYELVIIALGLIIFSSILNKKIMLLLSVIFLLFLFFFFRNYLPDIPLQPNTFLSPSSSKVTKIEEGENQNVVYTYLSPLDKHFMIAPVDCTIINIERGNRIVSDAERVRVTFKDEHGNIFSLDQIVSKFGYGAWLLGFIYPERCVVYGKVGQKLKQGERYGLIRFGSNMQYTLPPTFKVIINEGEHIQIGQPVALIK